MKCEKCGFPIDSENMYCSSCGEEIQLVPDFIDPIGVNLEDIIKEEITESTIDKEAVEHNRIEKSQDIVTVASGVRKKIIICIVVLILFASMAYMFNVWFHQSNSYEYQVEKAIELRSQEKYEQALPYLERAIKIDVVDPKAKVLLAKTYVQLREEEKAIALLLDTIQTGGSIREVYDTLIAIYISMNAYEEIAVLLEEAEDVAIKQSYQQYASDVPDFSVLGGFYDEVVPLKLLANSSGKIYYTLDGSIPTTEDTLYEVPIFLEEGSYEVNAYYVNEFGVASGVSTQTYVIDMPKPYVPEVNVYTGAYELPQLVTVNLYEGINVYYTIDGNIPTIESKLYTKPIPMLLGKHIYQFVSIDEKGVVSEVVSRSFDLSFTTTYSSEDAVAMVEQVVQEKVSAGKGDYGNLSGTITVVCNSAVLASENINYLVLEYYDDGLGSLHKTGVEYLVDANTGEITRGAFNDDNEYVGIPLTYE